MNVILLGASANPDRYSYKAFKLLLEKGHTVFPVNPSLDEIENVKVYHSLAEIKEKADVITVYLSPERSSALAADILSAAPDRIIFNPGAENKMLSDKLREKGIEVLNACTIVMLKTGEFEK